MPAAEDPIYFKAVLRPNPPLPKPVCVCLIAIVAATNLLIALIFVLHGAWPVTPFMGADVLFLAWAFASSSKAAKRREEVRLSRSALYVDSYPAHGTPSHTELNPYWVHVGLDETLRGRSVITLASHGRRVKIGTFLSRPDQDSFAKALAGALGTARQLA
jgi:uncharacterized membrane protein